MPDDLTTATTKQLLRDRLAAGESIAVLLKARATNPDWWVEANDLAGRIAVRRAEVRAIDAELARCGPR